jgi:protein-S-isoprenylcysteine O-methyltransferase Ste14
MTEILLLSLQQQQGIDIYTGRWDFVFISIILFSAFLLLIPFRKKVGWRAHGTYTAFIIALFAEMFGFPLTIYFISSYFGRISFQNVFLDYMNSVGMPIGLVITGFGLLLVVFGWRPIHKSNEVLITKGIYQYTRHPQYLGFLLITLGWLIHWPTLPTLIMWPILVVMYYKLAQKEDKEMEKRFGDWYLQYKKHVPMFIPITHSQKNRQSI